jgi:hypothetical protein
MTHLYRKFRERNSMGHDDRGIGTLVWEVARQSGRSQGTRGVEKRNLIGSGGV